MASSVYKIGDLAKEFDVTLRTLRFYEDRGLINPARAGTTRLYSNNDRERLRIALFGKRIGLSLGEIHDMLELHETERTDGFDPTKIRDIYSSRLVALEKHRQETNETIADLELRIAEIDTQLGH